MDGLSIPPIVTPLGLIVCTALLWWRVGHVEREVKRLRDWRHDEVEQALTGLKLRVGLMEQDVEHLKGA